MPAARVAATADAFVSGHEGKRQNLRVGAFRLEVRERRLLHGGQPLQQLATMMEIAIQAIADGEEVCQCVGAQCARCRGQPTLRLSSQSCGNEEPLDRREIHLEFRSEFFNLQPVQFVWVAFRFLLSSGQYALQLSSRVSRWIDYAMRFGLRNASRPSVRPHSPSGNCGLGSYRTAMVRSCAGTQLRRLASDATS